MTTFTDYMNKSLHFRKIITSYCIEIGNEAQETRNVLHLLDALDSKAKTDINFREKVMKWLKKGGTLIIRELAKKVGFDYWKSLRDSNIIDTFDSVSCSIHNNK